MPPVGKEKPDSRQSEHRGNPLRERGASDWFAIEWVGAYFASILVLPAGFWIVGSGSIRVFSLKLHIPPVSDESRQIDVVANNLLPWIFLALGILLVGAVVIYFAFFKWRPDPYHMAMGGWRSGRLLRLLARLAVRPLHLSP